VKHLMSALEKKLSSLREEQERLRRSLLNTQARLSTLDATIAGIESLFRVERSGDKHSKARNPDLGSKLPDTDSHRVSQSVNVTKRRTAGRRERASGSHEHAPVPLYVLLSDILADGKARTINQLAALVKARGFDFGDRKPLRTISFTLMGIARGRTIRRLGGNRWQAMP
jgi:hypothetical protein